MCEITAQGETFEDWMSALKTHYMTAHPEVMSDTSKTMDDMQKWMVENQTRFNAA